MCQHDVTIVAPLVMINFLVLMPPKLSWKKGLPLRNPPMENQDHTLDTVEVEVEEEEEEVTPEVKKLFIRYRHYQTDL